MIPLEELRERIDHVELEPTAANMDRILTILGGLVENVERIDRIASAAWDEAKGIQPD